MNTQLKLWSRYFNSLKTIQLQNQLIKNESRSGRKPSILSLNAWWLSLQGTLQETHKQTNFRSSDFPHFLLALTHLPTDTNFLVKASRPLSMSSI